MAGTEPLGKNGDEHLGVPLEWSQNARFRDEANWRTMSCGLCGFLVRALGPPPYKKEHAPVVDPGREAAYGNTWGVRPFGAWLANEQSRQGWPIEDTVANIFMYRATGGEELVGFLSQLLRLLARRADGARKPAGALDAAVAISRVGAVCATAWQLSAQTAEDCASGAGHGFFHFHLHIGQAVQACWADSLLDAAPASLTARAVLRWRWACAAGVYDAAGGVLSVPALRQIDAEGLTGEEWLCKAHDTLWTSNSSHFGRCAATVGMDAVERKLAQVQHSECPVINDAQGKPLPMAGWERSQASLRGLQQRTCGAATAVTAANDNCPAAFMAHFPCQAARRDYKLCTGGYHHQCESLEAMRTTFLCEAPPPRREGFNYVAWRQLHVP
eukprot:6780294-Prymnesium_polylepis.2